MTPTLRPTLRQAALAFAATALIGSAHADPAAASRYYEDGLARYRQQDVPGAIIQLKNALQQDRNMLAAHLLLARVYLQTGDIGPAEVEFREALRLGVSRSEVAVPLARIYLMQGRPARLIETLPADGLPPEARLELLTLRGTAFAALGNAAEAERSFAEARALDPRSAVPLIAEVPMLLGAGRLDEARERAARAIERAPAEAAALNARGSVAHAGGDLAAALQDYEAAIRLQPGFVDARVARAGILIDLGRDADARADLEDLEKSGPSEPRAAYLLSVLAERRGDAQAAARHLEAVARVVDALPPDWIAGQEQLLMAAALAHHAGRQYEKARTYLDVLVSRYPRNLGARKLLAAVHLDNGDPGRATGLLEHVLRLTPDDPQALRLFGRVHMALKRYAKASVYFERAAALSADAPALQAALGFSRLGKGEPDAALPNLQRAFEAAPADLGVATTLANLHQRRGEAAKAMAVAERAAAALPGNPAALNLLGVIRGATGDLAGARSAYRSALERQAGFLPARLNLARVDVLEGRLDAARATYAEMLKKDRRDATAMFESGLLEQHAGNGEEALRWFEKARAERPGDVRIGLALIDARSAAGDRAGALETARDLKLRNDGNLGVMAALARAEIDAGDATAARQTLREMTRLAEFDAGAQVRIGYLQLAAGNPDGAGYSAEKALQGRPGELRALVLAAEAALAGREMEQAERWTKELRATHPDSAEGFRVAGDLALARGQHLVAADAFQRALERQPSSALVLRRATTFVVQGKAAAAIPLLQGWLRTHERDAAVRKGLGELFMREARWADARREYERLIGEGAGDAAVHNNLANALLELADPGAVELARKAVALDPSSVPALDTLGWALARAGRADEAIGILRDARLRDPGNAEVRFHLASVLAAKGRRDEARAELRGLPETIHAGPAPAEVKVLLLELGM